MEVYATVTDSRGEPVVGLPSEAFTVSEDGRPQTITAFAAGDAPLSLAIAVDRSFSVSRSQLASVVRAVQQVLGELRPGDCVSLIALGSSVDVLVPLTTDRRAVYDAVAGLAPWGSTPLFDATVAAIASVQQGTGRRALLLITDGVDRYSTGTAAELIEAARTQDVLIYPVVLSRAPAPVLVELAAVTGGHAHAVPEARALGPSLSMIARELRHQYLLGYAPADAAGPSRWRSITVRVSSPGAHVRARDGYVAGR